MRRCARTGGAGWRRGRRCGSERGGAPGGRPGRDTRWSPIGEGGAAARVAGDPSLTTDRTLPTDAAAAVRRRRCAGTRSRIASGMARTARDAAQPASSRIGPRRRRVVGACERDEPSLGIVIRSDGLRHAGRPRRSRRRGSDVEERGSAVGPDGRPRRTPPPLSRPTAEPALERTRAGARRRPLDPGVASERRCPGRARGRRAAGARATCGGCRPPRRRRATGQAPSRLPTLRISPAVRSPAWRAPPRPCDRGRPRADAASAPPAAAPR